MATVCYGSRGAVRVCLIITCTSLVTCTSWLRRNPLVELHYSTLLYHLHELVAAHHLTALCRLSNGSLPPLLTALYLHELVAAHHHLLGLPLALRLQQAHHVAQRQHQQHALRRFEERTALVCLQRRQHALRRTAERAGASVQQCSAPSCECLSSVFRVSFECLPSVFRVSFECLSSPSRWPSGRATLSGRRSARRRRSG